MIEFKGIGKEEFIRGFGKADVIDYTNKIIYELKPNNYKSIMQGIRQLKRYNKGMGGVFKLVLVLY